MGMDLTDLGREALTNSLGARATALDQALAQSLRDGPGIGVDL